MELRHLRYFVAIAEVSSFRRAAERLHLTRPALSKQMRELEEELGVRLLDRSTTRVTLTPAGALYLEEARAILARVEQASALARETAQGHRGALTIGEPGPLGQAFLTPALSSFREQFPHVDIVLRELRPHEQTAALTRGEIQVGFAFDVPRELSGTIASFAILELRLGLAVSRTHPLAPRAKVTPADFTRERLLFVGETRRSEHAETLRKIFADAGLEAPRLHGIAAFGSLMTMIASRHGVSILPLELANYRPEDIAIVPLEPSSHRPASPLKVVWRRNDDSALVRNFLRALRRFARHAPA